MKMMFFNMHRLLLITTLLTTILNSSQAQESCSKGCDLALGSYNVFPGNNLTFISQITGVSITEILEYNRGITNQYSLLVDARIIIPFSCDCLNDRNGGRFLGHIFNNYNVTPGDTYQRVAETYYSNLTTTEWLESFNSYSSDDLPIGVLLFIIDELGDTYQTVAEIYYANLTTTEWLQRFNSYLATNIPDRNAVLNVTVNCSCGNADVDKRYGLFVTWPLREGDHLASVAAANNLTTDLVQSYNPEVNFSSGRGLVYIPGKDKNGIYPPMNTSPPMNTRYLSSFWLLWFIYFLFCS